MLMSTNILHIEMQKKLLTNTILMLPMICKNYCVDKYSIGGIGELQKCLD